MPGFNSSINLQLPLSPDPAVDPRLAMAVTPIHVAVHSLHKGVSVATGAWQPQQAEWPTVSPQMSLLAGQHRKVYMVAAVAIAAGQLCYVNAAGQMALSSAAAAATLPQAWATGAVLAGAVGEFIMFEGLLSVAGAVLGTKYYSANAAGMLAAAPGAVPHMIGICIAPNLLYMRIPLA